jgi:hypothetical protein
VWTLEDLAGARRSSGVFTPGPPEALSHGRWREAVARAKGWAPA